MRGVGRCLNCARIRHLKAANLHWWSGRTGDAASRYSAAEYKHVRLTVCLVFFRFRVELTNTNAWSSTVSYSPLLISV